MLSRPTSQIKTLGALREAGYRPRSIKTEMRANLRARLAAGGPLFPGILGYDRTVIPSVVNALLAGHDFILLGLRGQAKTRILRSLVTLLDPEVPVLAGSELNDDPLAPISTWGQRLVQEAGDDAPVEWMTRRAALQREAGDAGRLDRRPPRRHRPDQGGDPQAHLRRPGGDPLRDHPAHQPRHLRDQRAPRPRAAHPGGPVQHPRGARPADPRLSRAHPARPHDGLLGQPRGLHEPRQHHHAAQGPHLVADPHPLPRPT